MERGTVITHLQFLRPDGSTLTLEQFAGRPLLLIFLRHLA